MPRPFIPESCVIPPSTSKDKSAAGSIGNEATNNVVPDSRERDATGPQTQPVTPTNCDGTVMGGVRKVSATK